ncbi:MAG: N-6 DNA methylase [Clostridia bacterium]|nr:N-6 DNA methylase [Clostridia bacterium]
MSEQLNQSKEFSKPIYIGEWRVYDIGATTLRDLVKERIINSHTKDSAVLNKKPDALVVDTNKEIVLYVESKDDGNLNSEKQIIDAIKQEFDISKKVKAKIYAVRDSEKTIWMNPLTGNAIMDEHGNKLFTNIYPVSNPKETEKLIKRILSSISKDNDRLLKEKYLNPTDLAVKIHQKLWITKNVSPSTALYTFVEFFLFKYLSDLGVLKGMYSFDYLRSLYEIDGTTEVDVLNTYLSDNGARAKMKELFPEGSDGTGIINGNVFHEDDGDAKVFRAILDAFKVYENDNGKFINISKDFKSQLFESFLKQDQDSKNMGQFFTPLKIVDNMVRMVDVRPGMKICDPACGVGKFLLEAVGDKIGELYSYNAKSKEFRTEISLTGYDKYSEDNGDKTIILAKANALIYFSKMISDNSSTEFTKKISTDLLNSCFTLKHSTLGTLESIEEDQYDLILTNPPYVVNGSSEMKKLTSDYKWGGLGLEAMFLEWIIRSVKQGGVINIVVPDGILSNLNNKTLKSKIIEQCYINSIISLPVKAFFNTPKKTYILTLKKKKKNDDGTYPLQKEAVFCYICSSIGETLDVYRFDTPDNNDLKDAVDNYNLWRNTEPQIIEEVITKRAKGRFKSIPISDFKPSENWIIENWWTEEEQILLGLRKEVKKQTIDDFIMLINETEEVMQSIRGELECLK